MPNQYSENNTRLMLWLPKEMKGQLESLAKEKARREPAGTFSVNSLIRQAVTEYLGREEKKVAAPALTPLTPEELATAQGLPPGRPAGPRATDRRKRQQ